MSTGELVRELILYASAFSLSVLAWLAALNLMAALRGERRQWFYALARVCSIGAFGLVMEAVYRLPFITSEWRSWAYVVFLAGMAIGFIGVAVDQRSHVHSPDHRRMRTHRHSEEPHRHGAEEGGA